MSKKLPADAVSTLFAAYLREQKLYQKAPSYIESHEYTLLAFCRYMDISDVSVATITKQTILTFTEKLIKKPYSVATVNHYLRHVRAFLYWCMENDYLLPFKIKLLKDTTPQKKPYTREEIKVLLRRPFPDEGFVTWRSWAIVNLILGSGVRSMTISNMLTEDVDFENNLIYLRHSKDGKNNNTIVLVPSLKKALIAYLRHRTQDGEFLFPSISGTQMPSHGIGQTIIKYNRSRGVQQTSIHLLRHTFGAMWAENGGDVYQLQRIMTHKDIRTTQNYINMYQDRSNDAKVVKFNPLENI